MIPTPAHFGQFVSHLLWAQRALSSTHLQLAELHSWNGKGEAEDIPKSLEEQEASW